VINPIVNGKQFNGTFVQIGTQVTQQTWYIYREITSLTLQIVPPAIVPRCVKTNSGSANVCNSDVSICGFFAIGRCDPMRTLTGSLPGLVSDINKVSILTSTRISFGLNSVGFGGLTCRPIPTSSQVTAGMGSWASGLAAKESRRRAVQVRTPCNFVQGIHTPAAYLSGPWTDPASNSANWSTSSSICRSSQTRRCQK